MTKEEKIQSLSEAIAKLYLLSAVSDKIWFGIKDIIEHKKLKDIVRRGVHNHVRLTEELKSFSSNVPEVKELMKMGEGEMSYLVPEIVEELVGLTEPSLQLVLELVQQYKVGNIKIEREVEV